MKNIIRQTYLFILCLFFLQIGCEDNSSGSRIRPGDSTDEDDKGTDTSGRSVNDTNISTNDGIRFIPANCGDGILDDNEACDDGNNEDGDGCSADCLFVEPGYSCYPPGEPCKSVAICGDGVVVFPEQCDDGNLENADGCSDLCQVEIGWKCEGSPSVCTPTVCGDGIIEGAEGCDDGNNIPFDGCDERCQIEPDCSGGVCTSTCGDGLVMGDEECDDGNNIDGDGCSSDCKIEEGYICAQEGCEDDENCILRVSVVYRDFTGAHSDFGVSCDGLVEGAVAPVLGDDWKPRATAIAADTCISNFNDWYNYPVSLVGSIDLYPDGAGNYVNRYGPNGEQWPAPPLISKCADGPSIIDGTHTMDMCVDCETLTSQQDIQECNKVAAALALNPLYTCESPCPHDYANRTCLVGPRATCDSCSDYGNENFTCLDPCGRSQDGYERWDLCQSSSQLFDGNPLFFPLDELGTDMAEARIPEQYGYNGWPWEREVLGTATLHNFYFTTEITYWFMYDSTKPAILNFTGDDDVWVFINGQLVVDLGGVHVPLDGSVVINATNNFGMTDGNVYRINIFHAERKMEGSSFRLTLGGFNTARSVCRSICGDGVVGIGEECDDGEENNTGEYGKCGPDCKWGPRCGDGIVQRENGEHCDDGLDNGKPGKCPRSCREIEII